MDKLIKNIICKFYHQYVYKPKGRKLKISIRAYLDAIFYVTKYGCPWVALKATKWGVKVHYTTIQKFFERLTKSKVFEATYEVLFKDYYCNQITHDFKMLFIDSTMIKNVHGSENVGSNHYDRFRLGSKISTIVDTKGVPVTKPLITGSNIHDATLIEDTINSMLIDRKNLSIIADSGYVSESIREKLKNSKNITLIAQKRRNQFVQNTKSEKLKLKERHIVENFYSWIKKYQRIRLRMDRLTRTYTGFVYLSYMSILCKKF